jgi:hypothetical protein
MKRGGRAPARPGNEIIAWEYRTPRSWFEKPTPVLTVLDPDRLTAVQYVYELRLTSGDIACGLIDLVPITRREREREASQVRTTITEGKWKPLKN